MRPRFIGRLGVADAITVTNAVIGFLAVAAAPFAPRIAARLILLAAIFDGLDGVVARNRGSTPAGKHLDSLSDVTSFGVAPALIVVFIALNGWDLTTTSLSPMLLLAVSIPAIYVGMVIVRLGLYMAYDETNHYTHGVQSTLAATLIAAAVLAGVATAPIAVGLMAVLAYLMVIEVPYPDLLSRDAFIMGAVQGVAVLIPDAFGRAFPYAVFTLAFVYLILAPWFYWRPAAS